MDMRDSLLLEVAFFGLVREVVGQGPFDFASPTRATAPSSRSRTASSGSIGSIAETSMPVFMPVFMPLVYTVSKGFFRILLSSLCRFSGRIEFYRLAKRFRAAKKETSKI